MRSAVALLALLIPALASAQGPQFNYLDIDYVEAENDTGSEADGYGVSLSLPFPGSNNYLYGRYSTLEFETLLGDVKFERLRAGLGFASDMQGNLSLYTLFTYERFDLASDGGKEDGYGGELGLRATFGQRFDIAVAGRYLDLDQSGNDTGLAAQFTVGLTPGLGLYAGYESLFDHEEYRLGLRLTSVD